MADPNDPNQSSQESEESSGSGQINVARELNAVLEQVSAKLERIQKITQTQADFMTQMTQSFAAMQENMESMTGNAQEMSNSFQSAAESAMEQFSKENLDSIGSGVEKISEAYKDASAVQSDALKNATKSAYNMSSVTRAINEDMKKYTSIVNQALKNRNKTFNNFGEFSKYIYENAKSFAEELMNLKEQVVGIVFSIGQKIKSAMSMGFTLAKNIISFAGSMIGSVAKFTKFAVTVPFTITKAAVNIGNTLRRDIVEVIQTAQEALKEKFDMDSSIGEGISAMTNRGKGMLLAFQNPSSELVKLFGFGASGIASMIGFLGENLEAMGHFSEMFGRSLGNNLPKFKAFSRMVKGFGFSSEDLAYLAQDAAVNLKDINVRLAELGVTISSVSTEFGLDRKRLSRNFMILRKDITQFGHLSDEEIARTTARLTQMKVKLEDAAAVFKKFSTFEDAANSVAMLSQTFGMNLDAMDIIQAKNPEDIIEMFRTSMLETGRSFEDLNRFEKELMAQHTGMSAESLKGLMHYRDIGLTYEQARKRMESEKPTAKQMKALKELNSAIKEVQKVMNFDSPFQAFVKGLTNNLALSGELRNTLTGLSSGYEAIYKYALKLDPNTWSGLIKPIKLIVDIMANILKSDAFKGGLVNTMTTIADFAAEMFGATKGDVILSKLETNVSIAMQKGGKFYGKSGKKKITEFKKILLDQIKADQSLATFVNMKELEEIKDPRKFVQAINEYKQSVNSKNLSRIKAFDNLAERSAKELKKTFDKEEETKDNKKKSKKISTSSKGGYSKLSEGLTETINKNKDNLGKLVTLSMRIAGAVIKGASIGFTALLKVMNDGMEKVGGSNAGKDNNIIEDLLHFKPGEFAELGSAIGDAFKEFWEKRQNAYSITGWIIDGIKDAFSFVIGGFVDVIKSGINEILGKEIFEKSTSSMMRESQGKKLKDTSGSMNYGRSAVENINTSLKEGKDIKSQDAADLITALRSKAEKIENVEQRKKVLERVDRIENKFRESGKDARTKDDLAISASTLMKGISGKSFVGDESLLGEDADMNLGITNFLKVWLKIKDTIDKTNNKWTHNDGDSSKVRQEDRRIRFKSVSMENWRSVFGNNLETLSFMNTVGLLKEYRNFDKSKDDISKVLKTGKTAGNVGRNDNMQFIDSFKDLVGFDRPGLSSFLDSATVYSLGQNKQRDQIVGPAPELTVNDTTNSKTPIEKKSNDLISDLFMNRMKGMSLLNSNFDIMKNLLSSVQYPTVSESSMTNVEELNVASYNAGNLYSENTNISIERERRMTKEEAAQFKEKLIKTRGNVAASSLEVDSKVIINEETLFPMMKEMIKLGLINEATKNENSQGRMRLSASALDSATFNTGNYSATMKETYDEG